MVWVCFFLFKLINLEVKVAKQYQTLNKPTWFLHNMSEILIQNKQYGKFLKWYNIFC